MAIPTYDQFIFPLARVLADHPDGLKAKEAYRLVADAVGLSAEDCGQMLPSGRQAVFKNRIGWAHDRLKRKGYSSSPKRGQWVLTAEGHRLVKEHPGGLAADELAALAYVPLENGERTSSHDDGTLVDPKTQSPSERIYVAVKELNESVSAELLDLMGQCPPEFFERLVLQVLHKLGYGASEDDLEATPLSGDGGIDGIISLDKLGLEKVYVQAKRWTKGPVGAPEIQKFYGALAGKGVNRGVFITTSHFTRGAIDYADKVTGASSSWTGDSSLGT